MKPMNNSMYKPYFAMLYSQDGSRLIPMTDDDGDLAMFESSRECHHVAANTVFGRNFGYEVFCAGDGESA